MTPDLQVAMDAVMQGEPWAERDLLLMLLGIDPSDVESNQATAAVVAIGDGKFHSLTIRNAQVSTQHRTDPAPLGLSQSGYSDRTEVHISGHELHVVRSHVTQQSSKLSGKS